MKNKGFTLLELILCISIMCILFSVALLNVNIFTGQREKSEIREFVRDINYIRNRAIIESTSYTIYLKFGTNSYDIQRHTGSKRDIIKRKEFDYGIKLKGTNINQREISFNNNGTPRYSGEIILENSKGDRICITITPATGRVNVYYNE